MQRRELEYPTDFPLFSGMDEHGPQDEYATFLAQAVTYDTDELLEAVEGLANAHDVEVLSADSAAARESRAGSQSPARPVAIPGRGPTSSPHLTRKPMAEKRPAIRSPKAAPKTPYGQKAPEDAACRQYRRH